MHKKFVIIVSTYCIISLVNVKRNTVFVHFNVHLEIYSTFHLAWISFYILVF